MSTPNPATTEWIPLASSGGPTGPTGPQGPQGVKGDTGDTGAQGVQGNTGDTGSQGTPGEKWFSGVGTPSGATGIVGDWYIDTATSDIYEKTGASAWTLRLNVKGAQGIQGTQGIQGVQGVQGPAGVVTAFREGHTFAIVGELSLLPATLPSIFVPMSATQTTILRAARAKIGSGTSVGVQVKRNGSNVGSVITVTPTVSETSLGNVALANNDELSFALSAFTGIPVTLSLTFVLETTAT